MLQSGICLHRSPFGNVAYCDSHLSGVVIGKVEIPGGGHFFNSLVALDLCIQLPEVKQDLQSGRLNLSQVSLVAQSIRQKLKEQPDITFNAADKKHLLESVKGLSLENSQKLICQSLDLEVKEFEKRKVQSDESVRLELTLSKEQHAMLKKVKSLISHINPSASVADIFEYLASDYLKRKDPAQKFLTKRKASHLDDKKTTGFEFEPKSEPGAQFESDSNPESEATSAKEVNLRQNLYLKRKTEPSKQNSNKRRKTIAASVKRAVWQRDQGKCQNLNLLTGHPCGSQHLLEFDHIKRVRHGGENNAENLRLMCKAHNLWRG